jgi:hypothetical protein
MDADDPTIGPDPTWQPATTTSVGNLNVSSTTTVQGRCSSCAGPLQIMHDGGWFIGGKWYCANCASKAMAPESAAPPSQGDERHEERHEIQFHGPGYSCTCGALFNDGNGERCYRDAITHALTALRARCEELETGWIKYAEDSKRFLDEARADLAAATARVGELERENAALRTSHAAVEQHAFRLSERAVKDKADFGQAIVEGLELHAQDRRDAVAEARREAIEQCIAIAEGEMTKNPPITPVECERVTVAAATARKMRALLPDNPSARVAPDPTQGESR